jgi:hypothetical protein
MTVASPKINTPARVSPYRAVDGLRDWARGSDSTGAPAELLIRSFAGRFSELEQPWIVVDRSGQIRFDADVLTEHSGGDVGWRAASAGRRRGLNARRQSDRSCRGSHRFGSRSSGLGPGCATGDESVGLHQLRAMSEVADRSY